MTMTDPPSYDQDLLNRFNALKKSNITLDTNEYVGPFKSPSFIAEGEQSKPFHPKDSPNSRNGLDFSVAFLA
jgi:hypothetical protein